MGCLALLILAFIFRGFIWGALLTLLSLALSLGIWRVVLLLVILVLVAQ